MKYTVIDRHALTLIRNDLDVILGKYAEAVGLQIKVGSIQFTAESFTTKLECKLEGGKDRKEQMGESMARVHGLTTEWINGKRLVEYRPKAFKFPYVYEDKDGKRWKCSVAQAKIYFRKPTSSPVSAV